MDKQHLETMAETLEEIAQAAAKMQKILLDEIATREIPVGPLDGKISYEALHAAAMAVFQKRGRAGLKALLDSYSIKTLKELPESHYKMFFEECNVKTGVDYVG